MSITRTLSHAFIISAVAAVAASTLRGQDSGWLIERIAIRIEINADGTLRSNEAIDVDFLSLQRRGIFRDVDYRFRYNDRQVREYDIDLVAVTDAAGNPRQVSTTNEGATRRFRIGNPDRTITGKQTYRIAYTIAGALNGFPDHDELYWNATGVWPVPVQNASVIVTGPPASIERVDCFQGERGSTEKCQSSFTPGQATYTATRPLQPGEQLTIVAGIKKGVVHDPQPILVESSRPISDDPDDELFLLRPLTIAASSLLLVLMIGGVFSLWWLGGRDKQYRAQHHNPDSESGVEEPIPLGAQPIAVEFQPPGNLRPGQMGLLIDERVDTVDVTATIIDLAVRGHLRITEIPKKGLFSKIDWQLDQLAKDMQTLLPYEQIVLGALFDGRKEVRISELEKTFHADLARVKESLYEHGVSEKWFPRDPESVRGWWLAIGIIVAVGGFLLGMGLGNRSGDAILGAPFVVGGLLLALVSGAMPHRTPLGRGLFRRSLGFAKYIRTAEKHPQDFAERANIFTEYLPYAIMFGCVDKWANAFKNIDLTPQTSSWYSGPTHFNPAFFASSVGSFSSSVSSAMASTPGSSGGSGFSGGGSSGGGGGGGGGGSW